MWFFLVAAILSLSACTKVDIQKSSVLGATVMGLDQVAVPLEPAPSRIVTLTPGVSEMVSSLLGEADQKKIVGVSEYSDYPEALKQSAVEVGPYYKLSVERILALKPDLVIGSIDGNDQPGVSKLRELGVRTLILNSQSLKQIEESYLKLGQILRAEASAKKLLEGWNLELNSMAAKVKSNALLRSLSLVLQVGDSPLVVVGKNTFISELLVRVGISILPKDEEGTYLRPSKERIYQLNPDWIFILALGQDQLAYEEMKKAWLKTLPDMKASKSAQVRVLRADALIRPTVRCVEGLKTLITVMAKEAL